MTVGKYRWGWRKPGWPVPLIFCFLGIVVFYVAGPLVSDITQMNSEALTAFETGRYSVIEGVVTDFHPMPYEGHDDECFSVTSRRFCYSDYQATPGFHNAASHGGPIRPGLRVRIAHSGGTILRIEIAKDQVPSAASLSATAKSAQVDFQTRTENDPLQQRMLLAFLFTGACWTLWWNLQWKRAMRFWVRPPNRQVTQLLFRIWFAVSFVSSIRELVQQLQAHPLTRQKRSPNHRNSRNHVVRSVHRDGTDGLANRKAGSPNDLSVHLRISAT
jgi:hypothetical protein